MSMVLPSYAIGTPQFLQKIGNGPGTNDGHIFGPQGIAIDGSSNVYVVDIGNNRVQEFDLGGNFVAKFGNTAGSCQLSSPAGIAIDGSGNFFVTDKGNNRVVVFGPSPFSCLTQFGHADANPVSPGAADLSSPSGIKFGTGGSSFYIADTGNNRVQKFYEIAHSTGCGSDTLVGSYPAISTTDICYTATFGSPNLTPPVPGVNGKLLAPQDIALNSGLSELYVADTGNNKIQRFSIGGSKTTPDLTIGSSGSGNGQFANLIFLAMDSSDNLYVADTGNNRIQKFDSTGTFTTKITSADVPTLGIFAPNFLTVNSGGTSIYAGDLITSGVEVFTFSGTQSVPGQPIGIITTPASGRVSLSWTAPANNGGTAITDYIIKYRTDPSQPFTTLDTLSIATSNTITGLTNNQPYMFNIIAQNAQGSGFPASTMSMPSANPTTGLNFVQAPALPDFATMQKMIQKGLPSGFTMPSAAMVQSGSFNPFDSSFNNQNLKFTTAASISSGSLFSDYNIQKYAKPATWDANHVWSVPPSIVPMAGGAGNAALFSMDTIDANKPLFMPVTGADPLSNGAALKGVKMTLASGDSNLQVTSKFLNTPPSGASAVSNAAMYMDFSFAGGLNYGDPTKFATPPSVSFTMAPLANTLADPTANIVNPSIICPKVGLSLLTGSTTDNTGIVVTRDTTGDTSTVCGYTATVLHFSSYVATTTSPVSAHSGGDRATIVPPLFSGSVYGKDEYPLTISGKSFTLPNFTNTIQTNEIQTGQPTPIKLLIYSNNGPSTIQHVTLFTNLNGKSRDVSDSDTIISYDKSQPLAIIDPHGLFSNVSVNTTSINNKLEVDFTVKFAKPMQTSDIIIRSWDIYRASSDTHVQNAIKVIENPITNNALTTTTSNEVHMNMTSTAPSTLIQLPPSPANQNSSKVSSVPDLMSVIKEWGGYSPNSISDSQLLQALGLQGNHIPSWVLKTTKLVVNGEMSEQEFSNMLKYLSDSKLIK